MRTAQNEQSALQDLSWDVARRLNLKRPDAQASSKVTALHKDQSQSAELAVLLMQDARGVPYFSFRAYFLFLATAGAQAMLRLKREGDFHVLVAEEKGEGLEKALGRMGMHAAGGLNGSSNKIRIISDCLKTLDTFHWLPLPKDKWEVRRCSLPQTVADHAFPVFRVASSPFKTAGKSRNNMCSSSLPRSTVTSPPLSSLRSHPKPCRSNGEP